jgi:hypothetical protein
MAGKPYRFLCGPRRDTSRTKPLLGALLPHLGHLRFRDSVPFRRHQAVLGVLTLFFFVTVCAAQPTPALARAELDRRFKR